MSAALVFFVVAALAGDPAFSEGCKLYDALEYEQAVFRFQEVALRPELDATDAAVALTWLGLSYAGAGNMSAARQAFTDAAHRDPAVTLPVEVSPSLALMFDEAKAAAPPPVTTTTTPTTTPTTAPPPPEPSLLPAVGIATGGVLVVAGAASAGISALTFSGAQDKALFQSEARDQMNTANLELGAAYVLVPVGVVVGAVGVWALVSGGSL